MARTYHRDSKGRFAKSPRNNPSGGRISLIPGRIVLGFGPSVRGGGVGVGAANAARKSVAGRKVHK
jgi:hypothetical protein